MEPASSTKADIRATWRPAPWASFALLFSLLLGAGLRAADLDRPAVRSAIEKALPLLESSAKFSLDQRRCFTCHHVAHTSMAGIAAWRRGFPIDEENLLSQLDRTRSELTSDIERFLGGRFPTGQADMLGSSMWLLKEFGWPADRVTSDTVKFLVGHDRRGEGWEPAAQRPPTVGSKFTSTFLALQALDHFSSSDGAYERRKRLRSAIHWVENTASYDNEDMVHRLRALHLTQSSVWKDEGTKLLAAQREDGGWAQLPQMNGDAYATGTALAALLDTGFIDVESEAYQRGVRFLVSRQESDGSWFVQSRTNPTRPFYHSLFPHKHNQFISVSATAWSTYALLQAFPVEKKQRFLKLHPDHVKLASAKGG